MYGSGAKKSAGAPGIFSGAWLSGRGCGRCGHPVSQAQLYPATARRGRGGTYAFVLSTRKGRQCIGGERNEDKRAVYTSASRRRPPDQNAALGPTKEAPKWLRRGRVCCVGSCWTALGRVGSVFAVFGWVTRFVWVGLSRMAELSTHEILFKTLALI